MEPGPPTERNGHGEGPVPGGPARAVGCAPAGGPPGLRPLRRDPAAREIVRCWRRLTSDPRARRFGRGGRTLVACSGGADSIALLLTLAAATGDLVVGHVVHDLRPEAESLAGRDAARSVAERLGLPFMEGRVRVRGEPGNAEAAARRARYAALAGMAREAGCGFVATAHHADDQLETVLMSLLRGTGGAGVRGMTARRTLSRGPGPLVLVRPMLTPGGDVTRDWCRGACAACGVPWSEDATNGDLTRLRAAVRARVVPVLKGLRPRVGRRAVAAAEQAAGAERALAREASRVLGAATVEGGQLVMRRERLRAAPAAVLGEALRRARSRLLGAPGADRVGRRAICGVVRAIRDHGSDPRTFTLAGMRVEVRATHVTLARL